MKLPLLGMAMGLGGLLWFLLLAISHPRTVQGEVVENFQQCNSSFKDHIPPQGFDGMRNLVRICQRFNNRYHFATLYRTDLRIPVYSAYTYQTPRTMEKTNRPCTWFYEPQCTPRQRFLQHRSTVLGPDEAGWSLEDGKESEPSTRGALYSAGGSSPD
ncbi:endonuclease domain-containing 1 protein-like [Pristis pectinata]|uniref:endonuclease domain-containing 1 protein-like n=1 Tax=Pristis pectinata TaxID=685728 RepID=UPI00223C930A|nr:endonuclease domain-containing 1 protein-like [Pristis pectinata]